MLLTNAPSRPAFRPILVSDPVYLRTATMSDHASWAALREESRAHLIGWEQDWAPEDNSASSFRRRLRHYERQAKRAVSLPLLIFRRNDQTLLGGVTLSNIRYGAARTATIGYWIGHPYTRKGYGAVAVSAVLGHAFESIELNRVEAACQTENSASRSLLMKCGFSKEGLARDYLRINGAWRDHEIFAMTASDFRKSAY